jgi:hypothetical protein
LRLLSPGLLCLLNSLEILCLLNPLEIHLAQLLRRVTQDLDLSSDVGFLFLPLAGVSFLLTMLTESGV